MTTAAKQEKVGTTDRRAADAKRKAVDRTADRDIIIRPIEDRARRIELEADDRAWFRYYLGTDSDFDFKCAPHTDPEPTFTFDFSPDQIESIEAVHSAFTYGGKKCIAGPRGDGKTSITRGKLLKGLITRRIRFGLYIAASDTKAGQSEQTIKYALESSCTERGREFVPHTRLARDYPFECAVSSYVSRWASRSRNVTTNGGWKIHVKWSGDEFIFPSLEIGDADPEEAWEKWMIRPGERGSMLLCCGITSSILQGANVMNRRPDAVVLDDLDKRESLTVEDGKMAPKICEILSKTVAGMKGQAKPMGQVMLCTVTSNRSVAYRYSDPEQEPSWSGVRKKRIKKWPDRMDLWDEYIALRQKGKKTKDADGQTLDEYGREAHKFYIENREAMDAGAELGNYHIHDDSILPDGSQAQLSTLQWCFDYIADEGEESFKTEYQQEPPDEEGIERLLLTAYHVQHNARSGLPQNVVPPDTAYLGCGLDIKKIGFHYVVLAFSEPPTRAAVIEYNFHETKFAGEHLRVEDAERAILNGLHEWKETRDENPYLDMDGTEHHIDLSAIDEGWKHESWAGQPVEQFCGEVGFEHCIPCKGWGSGQYRRPAPRREIMLGDNYHISFPGRVPHVNWNTDHYKMKVHEGFLTTPGEPGSLVLFEPSAVKTGRRMQPHMSYAKHITSHVWEERFVPGYRGMVCKWWHDGAQDHYLDASAQGLLAGGILGATTLETAGPPQAVASGPAPDQPMATHIPSRSW